MTGGAADHLAHAERMLDRLAAGHDDPDVVIAAFGALADAVAAGLEVEHDADADVRWRLQRLREMVLEIGAAGAAAGVIEQARQRPAA